MRTLIKYDDFYVDPTHEYRRIYAIIDFVNILRAGLYTEIELEKSIPQAMEVYYIDYYAQEVEDNGLVGYFANTKQYSSVQNQFVLSGLRNMGAVKHAEIFKEACDLITHMDPDLREEYLEGFFYDLEEVKKIPEIKAINDELDRLSAVFEDINDVIELIEELNYRYVATIDNLKILNEEDYRRELKQLLSEVPDYEKRKRRLELRKTANEPAFRRACKLICKKHQLDFTTINAIDFGEGLVSEEQADKNLANNIVFYHLSTEQGYYYVIHEGNYYVLIKGDDNSVVGEWEESALMKGL